MSIRLGDGTLVAGGAQTFPLLSTMWADHILNDVSWLRADTFSWQSGDVYKSVYEKLVAEYATGTTETEGAITFKRTESGFKIADSTQEQAIIDLYNSTGVAWYYILDTTNRRFKLPRAKHTSTNVDVFGNGITIGVTDGINNFGIGARSEYISNQSIPFVEFDARCYGTNQGDVNIGNRTSLQKSFGLTSDPTKSGIVGKVQRENDSQYMYLYFFVGNYVQNQTAIDIGAMSEQLNGKVDKDSSFGFPSNRYIDLTLGASGMTYTAPANGYLVFGKYAGSATTYIYLSNNNNLMATECRANGGGNNLRCFLPVSKGQNITIGYSATGDTSVFRFIYSEVAN